MWNIRIKPAITANSFIQVLFGARIYVVGSIIFKTDAFVYLRETISSTFTRKYK